MSVPYTDKTVREVKLQQRGAPDVTIFPDGKVVLSKGNSTWVLTKEQAKFLSEALTVPPPTEGGTR